MQQQIYLFWCVGKYVVEHSEQDYIVQKVSNYFSYRYGLSSTFSFGQIQKMRCFYLSFPKFMPILSYLSWNHYQQLIFIRDVDKKYFYFFISLFCFFFLLELESAISNQLYEQIKK